MQSSIKLEPYKYVYIRDSTTLVTRIELGPQTFYLQDHEELVQKPTSMIKLPPKHYIIVSDPVIKDQKSIPLQDSFGIYQVRFGESEVRTNETFPDPFPLYPGESVQNTTPQNFLILTKDQALRVKVDRDYDEMKAGQIFHVYGPCSYIPRPEETVVGNVPKIIIKSNTRLLLSAKNDFTDRTGTARKRGEQWTYDKPGAFLPHSAEEVLKKLEGIVLTEKKALKIMATKDFVDERGIERKAGQKYLITWKETDVYFTGVHEKIIESLKPVVLSNREYVVLNNPSVEGTTQWGQKVNVLGEKRFFLQPNESITSSENVMILSQDKALDVLAVESFYDQDAKINRFAGEKWVIRGPREYVPPVQAQIVRNQKAIALDQNEGIYIRDLNTGEVKAVVGETVLLKAHEALWDKELPHTLEQLIFGDSSTFREKYKVVTYPTSDNTAVQIHDFKSNQSRIVFGPELIMLQPYELITVLSVSGGVPKRENVVATLCLPLGSSNFEDEITVETNDHASMRIKLSYSANFEINERIKAQPCILFSVPDYIGIACKTIASRIRGAVSAIGYNEFHHNYSQIIQNAIFGNKEVFQFEENSFMIQQCDVKSQELIDENIRDMLKKNTSLAIQLKTRANELKYDLKRKLLEEESNGELILQKLEDEKKAATAEIELQKLKVASQVIEQVGEKLATAKANAEGLKIKGESLVTQAGFESSAYEIQTESLVMERQADNSRVVDEIREQNALEVSQARKLAEIEISRFKKTVEAVGAATIAEMAKAGPESRAKLLKSLGIEGYVVTDGTTPVNLFKAAEGFVSNKRPQQEVLQARKESQIKELKLIIYHHQQHL